MRLKIWRNPLNAYIVLKFKKPGMFLTMENTLNIPKSCFNKEYHKFFFRKIQFFRHVKPIMCLNLKTRRSKPFVCLNVFFFSKVYVLCVYFFFSKIKAFMCLIGHVLKRNVCITFANFNQRSWAEMSFTPDQCVLNYAYKVEFSIQNYCF